MPQFVVEGFKVFQCIDDLLDVIGCESSFFGKSRPLVSSPGLLELCRPRHVVGKILVLCGQTICHVPIDLVTLLTA
jgi:hypothetical protein